MGILGSMIMVFNRKWWQCAFVVSKIFFPYLKTLKPPGNPKAANPGKSRLHRNSSEINEANTLLSMFSMHTKPGDDKLYYFLLARIFGFHVVLLHFEFIVQLPCWDDILSSSSSQTVKWPIRYLISYNYYFTSCVKVTYSLGLPFR